jgi:hypothetical protein
MKKYNNIIINDNDGHTIFNGSYSQLLKKFNNKEECDEYIDNCKESGYDYSSRTTYYDFEYDNIYAKLSNNWLEDICSNICYEDSLEMIENIILLSFKDINNVRCKYIGNKYLLVVLPKKFDSLLLYRPFNSDYDHKFFSGLLKEIYLNIHERHNRTIYPKIRVIEFVDNWRSKIKYADYNEGYTFYYNSIPQENRLNLLLQ